MLPVIGRQVRSPSAEGDSHWASRDDHSALEV
jgi:hypothetical protein